MRVLLKDDVLVLTPETAEEEAEITTWKSSRGDQVFCLRPSESSSVELHQLGPRVEACREPINAVSNSVDPNARLISNFAATPFDLDGRHYQSVDSFWQGLKFPDERDRRRVGELDGPQARAEGESYGATICYGGEDIVVGTSAHWRLTEKACRAKFEQNAEARAAFAGDGGAAADTRCAPRQHHHTGCHHGPNLDAGSQAHRMQTQRSTSDARWVSM
jgi:hypothetical protein